MKAKATIFSLATVLSLALVLLMVSVEMSQGQTKGHAKAQTKSKAMAGDVAKGQYLVTVAGCNDCHSPKVFTPQGPTPDTKRLLSGHPADANLPQMPTNIIGPDKWGALVTNDFTAWSGMWGTSFTFNLTPDKQTGLGAWTADIFIKAIRTGKHMGAGRDILPPMPWQEYSHATDKDLTDIFAYLQSLPPINNQVPVPIPPAGEGMPEHSTQGK